MDAVLVTAGVSSGASIALFAVVSLRLPVGIIGDVLLDVGSIEYLVVEYVVCIVALEVIEEFVNFVFVSSAFVVVEDVVS